MKFTSNFVMTTLVVIMIILVGVISFSIGRMLASPTYYIITPDGLIHKPDCELLNQEHPEAMQGIEHHVSGH